MDDAAEVGPLLDQVPGPVASFTGGGYGQEGVPTAIARRHPEAVQEAFRELAGPFDRHLEQ